MKRTSLYIVISLLISISAFAQQAAPQRGRGPQPIPLFFRENWKDTAAIPVTQEGVANADLEIKVYGATKDDMTINNEGGVPHVWNGLCPAVISGGTTGKIDTLDSKYRRAVISQQTGTPSSAFSRPAIARSFSWLSSTSRVRPRAARLRRNRVTRRVRSRNPPNGTCIRIASMSSSVRWSQRPTRNHSRPPGTRPPSRYPSAAASVDFPLPPDPTSATRATPRAPHAATSVRSSFPRPRNGSGMGGNATPLMYHAARASRLWLYLCRGAPPLCRL